MFDGMINISNEREKQHRQRYFLSGKGEKGMKRKVLSVLLCAAMTLGVVAGCGSSSDTGSTDSASKTETKERKQTLLRTK